LRTLLVLALLAPAFSAAAQSSDLIWTGDFEPGASSLSGNCSAGQDQWCHQQTIRPGQMQVVADPVVQGKSALRVEVKYGDVYPNMSDSRSLMTGPTTLWEDEGSERWYRWQALWPTNWVGSYPKWDELSNPDARSPAGSIVEWHHDANGGVETGSAPLYIGADDSLIWLCLVDQATSTCRERPNLAPLQRGHWHDFVLHAKWSSDPSVGFLEIWIDGVLVLPKHFASNKYPGMRNYMIVGLYRNGHIGDPNLRYPDGTYVYGTDGTPGVVYLDGFVAGATQASVLAEMQFGPPPAPPPPPPPPPPVEDAGTPPVADAGPAPDPVADAGTPAPVVDPPDASVPADPVPVEAPPAPVATAPADAGVSAPAVKASGFAAIGYPGSGCGTRGAQAAWLALPVFALLILRRRRKP
jgi:MYXO-CTERM domain-containing protein